MHTKGVGIVSELPSTAALSENPIAAEEMSENAFAGHGLSATAIVDSHKVLLEQYWDRLLNPGHESTAARSGTREPEPARVLPPPAMDMAIGVTQVRNVTGLGRILHAAQETAPVVCNKKTSEAAYVIGPRLMDEIIGQLFLSFSKALEQHQVELQVQTDAARAADSRRRFFDLCDTFEPIHADIAVSDGTVPSAAVEF